MAVLGYLVGGSRIFSRLFLDKVGCSRIFSWLFWVIYLVVLGYLVGWAQILVGWAQILVGWSQIFSRLFSDI